MGPFQGIAGQGVKRKVGAAACYPTAGAMRVNGALHYIIRDRLGSASVVLNDTCGTMGDTRYYPFGETREVSGREAPLRRCSLPPIRGNLVKKVNPDNTSTIYFGSIIEVQKDSGGTATGAAACYPAAGAMRVNGTLYYVLRDRLGSVRQVTDQSSAITGPDPVNRRQRDAEPAGYYAPAARR